MYLSWKLTWETELKLLTSQWRRCYHCWCDAQDIAPSYARATPCRTLRRLQKANGRSYSASSSSNVENITGVVSDVTGPDNLETNVSEKLITYWFLGPRGPLVEPSISPPVHPSVRNNFSWVHRWAVTLPLDLRDPSNHTFSESPWCQLSNFGWNVKYRDKYKDKYRDKYKDRDK